MSAHKITFEYASKRPKEMTAKCKCGWTGYTYIAGRAVTMAKRCFREDHAEKTLINNLKAVKDSVGGYRVKGTSVLWARQNECKCCWYVFDEQNTETVGYANSYATAKEMAFGYVTEQETK